MGKEEKQLYNIDRAKNTVKSHSDHFVSLIKEELNQFANNFNKEGILVCAFDFELFGHWWSEGVDWLKRVIELINQQENIKMITISDYVSQYNTQFSIIRMGESSWGEGGDFRVWKNPEHGWIWPYINASIIEFENILETNPNPSEWESRILKQTARELLLLEGSDWPFLLYTEQAKEYANQRFHHHHQRFLKLLWAAKNFNDRNRITLKELEEIESIDSCFQDVNIDYFKKRKV